MARGEWALQICTHFKTVMFILCRYPAFSAQYIRNHIDLPDTNPKELQDYKDNLVTVKRLRALLLVFVYIFYTFKNVYILFAWLDSFDYRNYKDNFKTLAYDEQQLIQMNYSSPADTLKHISCLYTNCTRLGPLEEHWEAKQSHSSKSLMKLLSDVSRLPVLALCYPMLEIIYYTPATKVGAFGIYAFLVSMYTHLLLGSWVTIQQILSPASNDLIMTITSPEVTRKVVQLLSSELLRDLALSLQNFRHFSIWTRTNNGVAPQLTLSVTDQDQWVCTINRADSTNLLNLEIGRNWCPSYARQRRVVSAPPSDSDKMEGSRRERTRRHLLVNSTLRNLYFRGRSEHKIMRAIDNCMPAVCTEWWRPHLARILASVSLMLLLCCILIGFSLFTYASKRISVEEAAVREFGRQMERHNCFVWLERASSFAPEQALSMDQLDFSWNFFSVLDAITLNFIGGVTGVMLVAYYWMLIMHLRLWLAEIRMFIVASLLATRFQHEFDRREAERDLRNKDGEDRRQVDQLRGYIGQHHFISTRRFYNIPNLREQFKESIRVSHMYAFKMIKRHDKWTYNSLAHLTEQSKQPKIYDFHLLNSKRSDRNYADRFLAEILFPLPANMEHEGQSSQLFDKIDYDIETMEQIYVNFRLLVNYVRSLNSSMIVLMTFIYLLNYGYILGSIICRRKFKDLNEETIFLGVVAFVITNYVIFLSADFHANAKQVQPLLWSLIAQLTYSKKMRVQHLRSLWHKQTVSLDNEGGLALIAYGVPITFVFIIQLIIWTASIFVLA